MTAFMPSDGSVLVVDDQIDEAMCLIQLLSHSGIPTTFYQGVEPDKLPDQPTQKIRLAFFDIQLGSLGNSNDYAQRILGLIEKLVASENGPYVIVLWSNRLESHASEVKSQILSNKNSSQPLSVIELSKSKFFTQLDDKDGRTALIEDVKEDLEKAFTPDDVARIVEVLEPRIPVETRWEPKSESSLQDIMSELRSALSDNSPGFELFTQWESQIHKAAGKTVTAYTDLHSAKEHWPENIKYVIYRMAQAQAGHKVVSLDNTSLMRNALQTLNQTFLDDVESDLAALADLQISTQLTGDHLSFAATHGGIDYRFKWNTGSQRYQFYKGDQLIPTGHSGAASIEKLKKAVASHFNSQNPPDTPGLQALEFIISKYGALKPEINGKLHVDWRPDESLQPGNLYVRTMPHVKRIRECLISYFVSGAQNKHLIDANGKFKLDHRELKEILFVELEVTPPCDFAQEKWLKSRVLPGIFMPESIANTYETLKGDNLYSEMPIIKFEGTNYQPLFNFSLFKSVDFEDMQKLGKPFARLRQEVHSDIISKLSNHVNRLGGLSPKFLPFVSRAFGRFDAHCWA